MQRRVCHYCAATGGGTLPRTKHAILMQLIRTVHVLSGFLPGVILLANEVASRLIANPNPCWLESVAMLLLTKGSTSGTSGTSDRLRCMIGQHFHRGRYMVARELAYTRPRVLVTSGSPTCTRVYLKMYVSCIPAEPCNIYYGPGLKATANSAVLMVFAGNSSHKYLVHEQFCPSQSRASSRFNQDGFS